MTKIFFRAALYGSPIIIWYLSRVFAGSLAEGSEFYGVALTLGPFLLFLVSFGLYRSRILPLTVYALGMLGSVVSGIYALWAEYSRWQGQGYDFFTVLSHLDYPLVLSGLVCITVPLFTIYTATDFYKKSRLLSQNKSLQGSAQWMPLREAKKVLSNGSLVLGEAYSPNKEELAGKAPLLHFDGSGHLITVAGSGGGKSVSVAIPNTLNWQGNLVVHDPKGELASLCAQARKAKGQKVVVLDPNSNDSDSINILDWIDTSSAQAIEDAQAIISWLNPGEETGGHDDYFEKEGEKLLLTLLLHVLFSPQFSKENKTLIEFRGLVSSGIVEHILEKDILSQGVDYGFGVPVQYAEELLVIAKTAEGQWAGIIGHASNITAWLSQPNLAALVSGKTSSQVELMELATGQVDFFINIPLKTLETTASPARLIIGALLNIKYDYAKQHQGEKPDKALFLLDEMPRLKKMEVLETARDAGRGAGIILWSIIQDLGQLEQFYQKHGCRSWLENAKVKTFFGISDFETAKLLSEMLGNETVLSSSINDSQQHGMSAGGNSGRSYQTIAKPLMAPSEIMSMKVDSNNDPDEQLIFVRNCLPIRCGMAKYYRRQEFNNMVSKRNAK
ncbi:type IV secretory system conjugative DNA transfer family protein [Pseudoalteromonas sp. A22]|uniref:type IV secretory system conjugative DNA transfer family protein n=1 Tax=Pseudoalteromonas sp. A22 TaxID=327511 RepID=UPI001BA5E630|nr:type IV secretory system conjugative DNA transfer family protein [Pseudoalteromonas sp. A22]QUI63122.1 type IV secretory system conjugative DNA transfer family protein [Pseudoalteromonas sp. A22]